MPIRITDLCKAFEGKRVLDHFSCVLPDAGAVAIQGASGVGKTTLINILLGLVTPDAGAIEGLNGRRVTAVFQEDRLIENWSAMKNIRLVCDAGVTDEGIRAQLGEVGLEGEGNSIVSTLSGGMRRRVALVRAVMAAGDILALDEPFKGLDARARERAAAYVRAHAEGRLVLIVTHDPDEARLVGAIDSIEIGGDA